MELTLRLNHQSSLQPMHITGSPKASQQIRPRPRRTTTQTCSVHTDLTFGVRMCWTSSLSSSSLSSSWRVATQNQLPWLLLAHKDGNEIRLDSAVLLQNKRNSLAGNTKLHAVPEKDPHLRRQQ